MDLRKILDEARAILKNKAKSATPPEEKRLYDEHHRSSGSHVHDEDNPLGLHRHSDDEEIDGAHIHTPENPGGEHVHGELKGQAFIDGWHTHEEGYGLGGHHHKK